VGSAKRFARRGGMELPEAYASWLAYLPEEARAELLPEADDWGMEDYRRVWGESAGAPLLSRLLDLNAKTYLLDDLLPKVDRMSMAHALEVRSPFLDTELASYAFRLAPGLKLRGVRLKRVLKAAFYDLIPHELIRRRKRGFGIPIDRWFRSDLRTYVDATLGSRDARVRDHLNGEALDRILAEHQSGTRQHGHGLWALLTLELFLRRQDW
jgi:asparagine synthase (glutamine-hydrolysing)